MSEHDMKVLNNALSDFEAQGVRCIPPIYRKALVRAITAVVQTTYSESDTKLAIDGTLSDLVDAIIRQVYSADDSDEMAILVMRYRRRIANIISGSRFMKLRLLTMMNDEL